MPCIDTLVIGAGQAGLAVSRCLTEASVEHVLLERGALAQRWRTERWDSLRLLTPNWATRLPGWEYRGDDPAGFMTAGQLVTHFERYAHSFDAPVCTGAAVQSVRRRDGGDGFEVRTTDAGWRARHVIIATGWCDRPRLPVAAYGLRAGITSLTPSTYRNPGQLPDGGVLVVGASASGVQIADELQRAGRSVVLAAGRHSRLPRSYRGLDSWWWLDRLGTFAHTIDEVADPHEARWEGSLQLVGSPERRDVDLASLQRRGVRLAGRLARIDGHRAVFDRDLAATTSAADERLHRLLADIDRHILDCGLQSEVLPPERPRPVSLGRQQLEHLHLRRAGITSIVWATGFTRRYPWLEVPVLDGRGEIRQRRGVTPVPGLYVLGQRFQHRRDANFIDGVRHDAAFVTQHLTDHQRQPDRLPS
jgi:putative flavoprotein involved in K+ transport